MTTIDADELDLYVWNTQSLYKRGLEIARGKRAESIARWRLFAHAAVASYRSEIGPARLEKGTIAAAAANFQRDFAAHAVECDEVARELDGGAAP